MTADGQETQGEGRDQIQELGGHNELLPINGVGQDSAYKSKYDEGQRLEETREPQLNRGSRKVVDLIEIGHLTHLRGGARK